MNDNTTRGGNAGGLDNARETIRARAADLASTAKEQAGRQFESRVGTISSEIGSIASALRRAGEELRGENGSSIGASVISTIAGRIETLGTSIGGRDLDGVLSDVQLMARRNPAAFMGSAAAIGFLAVRFLKSSTRSWTSEHHEELATRDFTPGFQGGSDRGSAYGSGASTTGWDTPSNIPSSGLASTAEGGPTTEPGSSSIGMGRPAGTGRKGGRSGSSGSEPEGL